MCFFSKCEAATSAVFEGIGLVFFTIFEQPKIFAGGPGSGWSPGPGVRGAPRVERQKWQPEAHSSL